MKENEIRIKWKQRAFSEVPKGTKAKLFTHVEPEKGNRLFENLNNRLEIKHDGTVGLKKDYNDGYFPILIGKEAKIQCSHPALQRVSKEWQGTVVKNTLNDISEMGSGNFSLELLAIQYKINESTEKKASQTFYIFRIRTAYKTKIRAVSSSELENFAWVRNTTDGLAYFREKKDYSQFPIYVHQILERDINNVKRETLYELPGWKRINQQWHYVCDQGVIGKPEITDVRVESDLKFEILKLDKKSVIRKFLDMENITKRKEISRTLMLFSCMSVMTTLFETSGFPIKSILAVLGTTNTLKTSTALVFTKIFNAEETMSPEVTFSSTRSGIETYVAKFQDAILLVDDFMPGEDKVKQSRLNSKLELLCRLYGDRTSKKRMTVFSNIKNLEYPVRGCCMITGEHMTGVTSSQTRIVCVNIEKGDVDKEKLRVYQEKPLILPSFLYGLIEFLTVNQEKVFEMMRTGMNEYRNDMKFKIARLNESAAHFLVTLDILTEYFRCEIGIDCEKFKNEWRQNVLNIFYENDRQLANLDVVGEILQALDEVLLSRKGEVKPIAEIQRQDMCFAYVDENFIYIQQKELYIIVKNYCIRYGHDFYLQRGDLVTKLKEQDVLECVKNSEGHLEAARKLQQGKGITRRFLYIKRKRMKEILEKLN